MVDFENLELKRDYQDTKKRFDAFWDGGMIDRPILLIFGMDPDCNEPLEANSYYTRIHSPLEDVVRVTIENTRKQLFLGEAMPYSDLSFGPDETAAFCGGSLEFKSGGWDTNWSVPFVKDWRDEMPVSLKPDNKLWVRMQKLMDMCDEAMRGIMMFSALDLHTNLDMLAAMRGGEQLCYDLIDCPDVIDEAMEQTMAVFGELYERAYRRYNLPGPCFMPMLQCDFSYMIGSGMFRRFVLPYVEREAAYFNNRVFYHWDGKGALVHADDLIASKSLYLFGYVPGTGQGTHADYLELYGKIQKAGKAVMVSGSFEECQYLHKRLKPEKTVYVVYVKSEKEAESAITWFKHNT